MNKILIVDDEESIQILYADELTEMLVRYLGPEGL